MRKRVLLIALAILTLTACSKSKTTLSVKQTVSIMAVSPTGRILPNDSLITITGAFYLKKSPTRVVLNRFTEAVLKNDSTFIRPEKARTQSGVCIYLATNSSKITFNFEKRDSSWYRYSTYGIFRNGKLIHEVAISPEHPVYSVSAVKPDSLGAKAMVTWMVALPHFYGLNFTGITVDSGSTYAKVIPPAKVYVAIGNSITHGTGQKGSYQTYPFLLAQKKHWTLYNLAVGGSRTSWPVATLLRGKKADVITILWGYNDWNAGFTLDQERTYYRRLVEELLRAQPKAQIYCITPTFTYRTAPKRGDLSLDDLRNVQARVVQSFQNKGFDNLHLLHGEAITDSTYLSPKGSKDIVHFTVEGAAKFADQLAGVIKD